MQLNEPSHRKSELKHRAEEMPEWFAKSSIIVIPIAGLISMKKKINEASLFSST